MITMTAFKMDATGASSALLMTAKGIVFAMKQTSLSLIPLLKLAFAPQIWCKSNLVAYARLLVPSTAPLKTFVSVPITKCPFMATVILFAAKIQMMDSKSEIRVVET